jgi:hypothetical protein
MTRRHPRPERSLADLDERPLAAQLLDASEALLDQHHLHPPGDRQIGQPLSHPLAQHAARRARHLPACAGDDRPPPRTWAVYGVDDAVSG